MKKEIYNIEGIEIEVEKYDKSDKDAVKRRIAYCFKMIREKSGMTRTDYRILPIRQQPRWRLLVYLYMTPKVI